MNGKISRLLQIRFDPSLQRLYFGMVNSLKSLRDNSTNISLANSPKEI